MAILALSILASSASFADVSWDGTAGAAITIDATANVTGSSVIVFNPSAQVSISGGSAPTSFAVEAVHDAVQGKDVGQKYGMAADSSNVFWISASEAYTATTATNSSPFSSWNK